MHAMLPTLHGLLVGGHVEPALHAPHIPLLQYMFAPHGVPFATLPAPAHIACPVLQWTSIFWHVFAGVQSAPVMQGMQAPLSHTPPSHAVPSMAMPVSVQACSPPSAHSSTPERHIPGEHAVVAGTHPELDVLVLEVGAPRVDPLLDVADDPPLPATNVKSPTIDAHAADVTMADAARSARRNKPKLGDRWFIGAPRSTRARRPSLPALGGQARQARGNASTQRYALNRRPCEGSCALAIGSPWD
jgi:hypothetical protein